METIEIVGAAMETIEIVKVYGPLGIGWIAAVYLMQFILKRYDADIQSKSALATAIQQLTDAIRGKA